MAVTLRRHPSPFHTKGGPMQTKDTRRLPGKTYESAYGTVHTPGVRALAVLTAAAAFLLSGCGGSSPDVEQASAAEMTDDAITWAVERDLRNHDAVDAHLIQVRTREGVVTLSGTVSNILAEERALELARATRGVRAVVDEIGVRPVQRRDRRVELDIVTALARDPVADSYELTVDVEDGTVRLGGSVQSWAERQITENVAKGVRGVKEIVNEIQVDFAGERTDAEIRDEIERRLELNPLVRAPLIDVKVDNGMVTLAGDVGSLQERREAYGSALVAGVRSVSTENIEIDWTNRDESQRPATAVIKSDAAVAQAVRDALLYDPRTLSFQIDVEAENGTVTLRGMVDNLAAKRAAGQDARNTIGVGQVDNRIKVRPVEPTADAELAADVSAAIARDPYLERHEIATVVRNAKAYLYGNVDTYFEKDHAEGVISGIDGVAAVENRLDVTSRWVWRDDDQIEAQIERELIWNAAIESRDIEVDVDGGTAVLTGDVDSWHEFYAAIDNAFEGGAAKVDPQLAVDGATVDYPETTYGRYFYNIRPN
ncbi:MAG: BON domain-containing protein [Chitinivibrionales bacterium]|nr:BON domain-containing protein [Chitinivibrionales bacterium]